MKNSETKSGSPTLIITEECEKASCNKWLLVYNRDMARKSFSRRVVRKIKRTLKLDEAQEILRKEFSDDKGNKSTIIYDVKPQKWNAPTIEIENSSKYTPKGEN